MFEDIIIRLPGWVEWVALSTLAILMLSFAALGVIFVGLIFYYGDGEG